jgi:eukaryotic-like serine/threonine-protein kinase
MVRIAGKRKNRARSPSSRPVPADIGGHHTLAFLLLTSRSVMAGLRASSTWATRAWATKRRRCNSRTAAREEQRFGPALDFDLASFGAEDLLHALAEYKEAVRLKPSNPYFRVEYGDAMVLHADIKGALADYREAARLAGRDKQLHEHITQVSFVKGELDLAMAEIQEQIRLYPQPSGKSFERLFLGVIHQKQGNKRLAFAAYRDQLLRGSLRGDEFLRLALGTTGTPEDVFRAYRDAVRTEPGDSQLQRAFLNVCLTLGTAPEVQSALEADTAVLRDEVRLQPNKPHLRHSLAATLLARGDRKEAAIEFRKALEAMQKDPAGCNGPLCNESLPYSKPDQRGFPCCRT